MSGWLKPKKQEAEPLVPPEQVAAFVPASVRQPEVDRFTPLTSDLPEGDDDEHDEDLDFLESIARSVEEPSKSVGQYIDTTAAAPKARQTQQQMLDEMQVFREMKGEIADMKFDFKLDDVDMADLLEDLSTTASALRQRKAA
jgi:hypothetical protein